MKESTLKALYYNKYDELTNDMSKVTHIKVPLSMESSVARDILMSKIEGLITIPENTKSQQLYNTVIQFMKDQDITCEETIHQTDRVIENAYDFISDLFNIVKDDLNLEDDE